MQKREKEILLLLTDEWADWEAAYAISGINETQGFSVKTIASDYEPKQSIGGLRALIDYSFKDFQSFENTPLVILPGGYSWQHHNHDDIIQFITLAMRNNVVISALCGATLFLAQNGFLDTLPHTGDSIDYFENLTNYNGTRYYQNKEVVVTPKIITAKETGAVEFAYEIFKLLKIDTIDEIELWYQNFRKIN